MEISSQEDHDIPIPVNSAYGGGHGHLIHHHHHDAAHAASAPLTHNNSNNPQMPSNGSNKNGHGHGHNYDQYDHDHHHHHHLVGYNSINYKKQVGVKYKECLKNHAASMGGNATDGCGEFMPSGEEGSIEALTCSACNCHRNFHRKEVEGELMLYHHPHPPPPPPTRKLMLTHHPHNPHKIRSAVPHQMIMPHYIPPYMPNSESEDHMDEDVGGGGGGGLVLARPAHHQPFNHHTHQQQKKRFRTKFTKEQKEKMFNFAERVGWKIQRQEESVVQQFCQEIGVKRRVLKVWMHNNKHNLAKKNNNNNSNSIDLSGNNDNNNNANTTTATGNLASSA